MRVWEATGRKIWLSPPTADSLINGRLLEEALLT